MLVGGRALVYMIVVILSPFYISHCLQVALPSGPLSRNEGHIKTNIFLFISLVQRVYDYVSMPSHTHKVT